MAISVTVVCPNPECAGRHVDGEDVDRETWTATWVESTRTDPGYFDSSIHCPRCATEGVDPEDPGRLSAAEEELGTRCPECGVVSKDPDGGCPHCAEALL